MRIRQGLILIAGAIAIAVLIGSSSSGFHWTPFALGLTYLVAALSGGRRGSYWATAVVLVGWGLSVLFVSHASPNLDTSGLYLLGAGLGAGAGAALARRGFDIDPLAMALVIAAGGGILAFEPRWTAVLGDARTYALLLGLVGLVNVMLGARLAAGASRAAPH